MGGHNREKIKKDWRKELTRKQYEIMRNKGTKQAFSGKYWNNKEKGIFTCAGCGAELFSSDAKFDSGTGWPSFDQALPGEVEYHEDRERGMTRTEVSCARCGGHLGHLFDDGPRETTGKRYCINSACLKLEKS